MLARGITKQVPIPHEPGEWFEFRQLGFTKLEAAQTARLRGLLETTRDLGDLSEQLNALQERAARVGLERQATKYDAYDKPALLALGVAAWSYRDEGGAAIPVTPETIAELDHRTAEWAFRALVDMHVPDEDEEDRKNA